MSGAVAAHAAYNGSGTQGLAVTNKIQDQEGDVMSVFWNKNDTTRQLLHGSTILEVPASGNNGNVDFSGTKIFTINNDIDCLGELYLNMKVTIKDNFETLPATLDTTAVAIGGEVKTLVVTSSAEGAGYAQDDELTLVQSGNSSAKLRVATVDGNGAIQTVEVIDGGGGYTVATGLSATGGSPTTPATFDITAVSGSVRSVSVAASGGGSGYAVGDEVSIDGSTNPNKARAIVTAVSGGGVTGITLIDGGLGYTADTGSAANTTNVTSGATGTGLKLVTTVTNGTSAAVSFVTKNPKLKFKLGALTNIIERVEYQVGTQIWQTLEKDDVRVVYNTELSEAAYNTVSRRGSPSNTPTGEYDVTEPGTGWYTGGFAAGNGKEVDVTFIIPALTKTLAPQLENFTNISESGYPLAAAPHQSVKLKIYLANVNNVTITGTAGAAQAGEHHVFDVVDSPYLSTVSFPALQSGTITAAAATPATVIGKAPVNIKSIKLYAKHIIMCNEEREQMKMMPLGLPKRLKMSQNSLVTDLANVTKKTIDLDHFSLYGSHLIISGNLGKDVYIKNAELKLNSSSFSGVLPAQMLDYAAASSLGLYVNRNIENKQTEALDGVGILVFPLSSSAYSGSSVPLNRFDSIRLTLEFTAAASPSASPYISITCIGETTALFKGGAASLAMY